LKERLLLAGGLILLALILIVGGIGWRAKWFETKFNNERVEHSETQQEKGLGETLQENMSEYHRESTRRRDRVDEAISEVLDASAPNGSGNDGDVARAHRADDAWRRGIIGLCPECAPDDVGDPNSGRTEGVSRSDSAAEG
jgi:hypothetical protein